MLDGIRLQNFRSFRDTKRINFKPLTIFVGQNSSGKSSMLRTIPLIKQSIKTNSEAPILWYGSDVDFGSINDVRGANGTDNPVSITFYFDNIGNERERLVRDEMFNYFYYMRIPDLKNISITINLGGSASSTTLVGFVLNVADESIDIELDSKGRVEKCLVNKQDLSEFFPKDVVRFSSKELVPQMEWKTRRSAIGNFARSVRYRSQFPMVNDSILDFFKNHLHPNTSMSTISKIKNSIVYAPLDEFIDRIKSIKPSLASWPSARSTILNTKANVEKLRNLYFMLILPSILENLLALVSADFRNAAYIGPSRATGERYYRHQELAVDQIDPQGRNMAMFLSSLNSSQIADFSNWLADSLGYLIKIERTDGHVKIELRNKISDSWHNLADMGYGFSQILPVMVQIWSQKFHRVSGGQSPFFSVEQPELHLHPAYQGMLADIFSTAATQKMVGPGILHPKFVIETHSEAFLNRLGELILSKKIKTKDVAIYLFEKSQDDENTTVRKVEYTADGILKNWPIGFFSTYIE